LYSFGFLAFFSPRGGALESSMSTALQSDFLVGFSGAAGFFHIFFVDFKTSFVFDLTL